MFTAEGWKIDLTQHCPQDVKLLAKRASQHTLWADWTKADARSTLAPRPFWQPMRAALKQRGWTQRPRDSATAAVAKEAWTQSRAA